jgi:cytochrome c-type biogenesis protein CcsB
MINWATCLFYATLIVVVIAAAMWLVTLFYKKLSVFIPVIMALGWLLLSLSIIVRALVTGHGPFSNIYEFSLAFTWGILLLGLIFWWRNRLNIIVGITTVLSLVILIFAATLSSRVIPLVPALQQSVLLSLHVTAAVIAYGAFAVGFGIAVVYLARQNNRACSTPELEILDRIGYQAVIIGFPFMSLTIILGAIWADIAWGRYWGWDPKETASLITWLIYTGYLHVRVTRGWRGKKSAVLLIVGFCAVLFTFFGNYIFQGLHSYL